MSKHDETPSMDWRGAASRVLSMVGRFRFLLLLVIPICVFGAAYLLYAQTSKSVDSIVQLYSAFPSDYQTISPAGAQLAPKGSGLDIGEDLGLTTVTVSVDRVTEFRGRILWLTALLVFFLVGICAAVVSAFLTWESLRDGRIWPLVGFFSLVIIWAPVAIYDLAARMRTEGMVPSGNPILDCLSAYLARTDLDVLSYCVVFKPLQDLEAQFYGFAATMHAGYVALLSILMVMLGTLAAACSAGPPGNSNLTPQFLSGQMLRGQVFLYATSAVMAFALIYNSVWLRLPIEVMPHGALRQQLSNYVSAVVGFVGVTASAMLLSTYIPLALIHRWRARQLARDTLSRQDGVEAPDVSHDAIRAFIVSQNIQVPLVSQLQRIGAMLTPALVSPIISAFELLTSQPA